MPGPPPQDEPESYQPVNSGTKGNTMHSDLMLDAVRAEAAYRAEELRKAGRSAWAIRARRAARHFRAGRTDVDVPAQERREATREIAGVGETAR